MSYNVYECLIPIAMHNGGVYIVGTDSASFVMIATTAYFS